MRIRRVVTFAVVAAMFAAGCSADEVVQDEPELAIGEVPPIVSGVERSFPPAPSVPSGPVTAELAADLDSIFATLTTIGDNEAFARIGESGDARTAWLLTDILRFVPVGGIQNSAIAAWEELTGVEVQSSRSPWNFTTDHLIAWDLPAPPGYLDWKRQVFELVEPGWAPLFEDADATIDWRWVSWGGVRIDDRPLDQTETPCPQGCIPALNDPALTPAAEGDWYADDRLIFGVVIDDEAVAFPKNIMEVHEMINMTVGGRRIAVPYCTLCGSAQAYLTDVVADGTDLGGADTYELRTSGLLSRSNKVMYEFHTKTVFDTFTGEAVAGPLRAAGVTLEQVTVQTSTWGDWKQAHPDTSIIAEDGGIGRTYLDDPLRGRDDNGPIFPIGDVDPRLKVQESVVGVVLNDGTAIAFPAVAAAAVLAGGGEVSFGGATLSSNGDGFTAVDTVAGAPVAAHQAFWFAWSQFEPETLLWLP